MSALDAYAGKVCARARSALVPAAACARPALTRAHTLRGPQCIYLCSAQASNQLTIVAQRKVETALQGLKVAYTPVDGMEEENKPVRKAIWDKYEAKPGTYPILVDMQTGSAWFGDDLQELIDNGGCAAALAAYVGA